jgi:hypothetical protein
VGVGRKGKKEGNLKGRKSIKRRKIEKLKNINRI